MGHGVCDKKERCGMSKKSKHINVRFDSELYDVVEQIAKEKRMSKSEVVRQAIDGQLSLLGSSKADSLSDTEREEIMGQLGQIMTTLSTIKRNNILYGNNVNQIAKIMNSGGTPQIDEERFDRMVDYGRQHVEVLKQFSKAVDELWRILV